MRPRHSDFCDRCDWRLIISAGRLHPSLLAQRISPGRRWAPVTAKVHREHRPYQLLSLRPDGEQAKSRRRQRRRGRRCGYSRESHGVGRRRHRPRQRRSGPVPLTSSRVDRCAPCTKHRLEGWSLTVSTVHETAQVAALIGRVDRRGRLLWSLPSGAHRVGRDRRADRHPRQRGDRQCTAALGRIDCCSSPTAGGCTRPSTII